jgi:hypothetical protein
VPVQPAQWWERCAGIVTEVKHDFVLPTEEHVYDYAVHYPSSHIQYYPLRTLRPAIGADMFRHLTNGGTEYFDMRETNVGRAITPTPPPPPPTD